MSALSPSSHEYEFTKDQNRLLSSLAVVMRHVSLASIGFGLLTGGIGVFELLSGMYAPAARGIVQGFVFFLTGLWVGRAGQRFHEIVHTRGHDMASLIDALAELRQVFALQRVLLAIGLVFAAAYAVIVVIAPGAQ